MSGISSVSPDRKSETSKPDFSASAQRQASDLEYIERKLIKGSGLGTRLCGKRDKSGSDNRGIMEFASGIMNGITSWSSELSREEEQRAEAAFFKTREKLIREHGLITWNVVGADNPHDSTNPTSRCVMTWRKNDLMKLLDGQKPTDADLLHEDIPEISQGWAKKYQSNLLYDVAIPSEIPKKIIDNSGRRVLTDLALYFHGNNGAIGFPGYGNQSKDLKTYDVLNGILTRLRDAGLLKAGARVGLSGCYSAKGDITKDSLQLLSNEFKVQIMASDGMVNSFAPHASGYISFFPISPKPQPAAPRRNTRQ